MTPTRRQVLGAAGVLAVGGFAGCTGGGGGGGSGGDDLPGNDTGGNNSGGTRPEGTGGPGISFREIDDAPDLPIRPTVEIVAEAATEDHPPGLEVTLTNESEEAVRVGEGRDVTFAYVYDTSNDLVLLPADGEYPAEAGCWRLTDGIAVTEEYQTFTLDAGESVSAALDLYGVSGGEGCLPVGDFRFESRYSVTTNTEEIPTDGESATWGFSVALE
jgi:hypothetical protein